MPYQSISELPEQFHGLPEKGKRIAVHIMNILEEQGMIGDGAVSKALGILSQIFNKGVGSSWGQTAEKAASVWNSVKTFAPFAGLVPGLAGHVGALNVGIAGMDAVDKASEQRNRSRDAGFDGNINKIGCAAPKENNEMNKIIKFDPNWSRTKEAAVKERPLTNVEFQAAKLAFAKNLWEDLTTKEIPLNLATYENGVKTASAKVISSLDFTQAFPKIASVLKTAAGSITTSVGAMAEKIIPIALAMSLAQGGKSLYDAYKSNRAYKGMFENYPDLKDADKGRVDKLYNVISNYSPTIAKDPVGSGAMIRTMLSYPDALDFSMIKGLIDLERGVPSSLPSTILDNMAAEAGSAMIRPDEIEKMDQKFEHLKSMIDSNPSIFSTGHNAKGNPATPDEIKNSALQHVFAGTKL